MQVSVSSEGFGITVTWQVAEPELVATSTCLTPAVAKEVEKDDPLPVGGVPPLAVHEAVAPPFVEKLTGVEVSAV